MKFCLSSQCKQTCALIQPCIQRFSWVETGELLLGHETPCAQEQNSEMGSDLRHIGHTYIFSKAWYHLGVEIVRLFVTCFL